MARALVGSDSDRRDGSPSQVSLSLWIVSDANRPRTGPAQLTFVAMRRDRSGFAGAFATAHLLSSLVLDAIGSAGSDHFACFFFPGCGLWNNGAMLLRFHSS